MLKYLLGFLSNLFNRGVSFWARVDSQSCISRKAKIHRRAQIFNSKIEDYSYIGVGTRIIFSDVGRFCSIGEGCICGMGTHTLDYLSTSPIFTEKSNALGMSWSNKSLVYPFNKLTIGNDVWIGARVMIMGGLTIGDGAVIGAGAIVTKDVPPYAIVAGVPARIIRYRFDEETIKNLLLIGWWNKDIEVLKSEINLFQSCKVEFKDIEDKFGK